MIKILVTTRRFDLDIFTQIIGYKYTVQQLKVQAIVRNVAFEGRCAPACSLL